MMRHKKRMENKIKSRFLKKYILNILCIFLIIFFFSHTISARVQALNNDFIVLDEERVKIDLGGKGEMEVHGSDCVIVENIGSTSSYFVPLKTEEEWVQFRANVNQNHIDFSGCSIPDSDPDPGDISGNIYCLDSTTNRITIGYNYNVDSEDGDSSLRDGKILIRRESTTLFTCQSDPEGGEDFCKFNRATCPYGWSQYKDWSTTTSTTCTGLWCGDYSCTTDSHSWSNTPRESCTYYSLDLLMRCTRAQTCLATRNQIGCVYGSSGDSGEYRDVNLNSDTSYQYILVYEDSSGNRGTIVDSTICSTEEDLTPQGSLTHKSSARYSITMNYEFSNSDSSQVSLFRGNTRLTTFSGEEGDGDYTDTNLNCETSYTYRLRDGTSSSDYLIASRTMSTGDCPDCVPVTCGEVGAECGTINDGCGGFINCGSCPPSTSWGCISDTNCETRETWSCIDYKCESETEYRTNNGCCDDSQQWCLTCEDIS